jgi:predicted RNase H-like HicB family nuclease
MSSHLFDLSFRVLIYEEAGEYVAHALELDLVGSGKSPEKAQEALQEAIICQLTFAAQKNEPNLLPHRAPDELFERWERTQMEAVRLVAMPSGSDLSAEWKCQAAVIEIKRKEITKASRRKFVEEPCLA